MTSFKKTFNKYIKPGIIFVCLSPLSQATARPALRYSCRPHLARSSVTLGPPQKISANGPVLTAPGGLTRVPIILSITGSTTVPVTRSGDPISTRFSRRQVTTINDINTQCSGSFGAVIPTTRTNPVTPTPIPSCGPQAFTTSPTTTIVSTGFVTVSTHMACGFQGSTLNTGTSPPTAACLVNCVKLPGYESEKPLSNTAYSVTLYNFLVGKINRLHTNRNKHKAHKKLSAKPLKTHSQNNGNKKRLNRKHNYLLAKISTSLVLKELNKVNKDHKLKAGEKITLNTLNEAQKKVLVSYRALLQDALKKTRINAKNKMRKNKSKHKGL